MILTTLYNRLINKEQKLKNVFGSMTFSLNYARFTYRDQMGS